MDGSTVYSQKMAQLHHFYHLQKMLLCIWDITSEILKHMKLSYSLNVKAIL